jgi:hypothetical protein
MSQITRSVTEHVNLGSYEWAEYSASITYDVPDGVSADPTEEFIAFIDAALDRLVARDRARYAPITTEDDSVLHVHPALSQES